MKRILVIVLVVSVTSSIFAQQTGNVLNYKMEELTAPQFKNAVSLSHGVCVIPLGILEKHGSHLPLGTDLILARAIAFKAVENE